MGSRIGGPGESDSTRKKEEFFAECMGYHLAREARFLKGLRIERPYFHLDLNAGAGHNPKSRTAGTPVLFMRQAVKHPRLPIDAQFIEKNPQTVAELRKNMERFGGAFNGDLFGLHRSFRVLQGDNAELLRGFVQYVARTDRPEFTRGSLISDPNGWSPAKGAVSLDGLRATLERLPYFMLLLFFPYGLAKMVRGYVDHDPEARGHTSTRCVHDYLSMRSHWLISPPRGAPPNVYLCGTRVRYRPGRHEVALDSIEGREILKRVCSCGEKHAAA